MMMYRRRKIDISELHSFKLSRRKMVNNDNNDESACLDELSSYDE
jgi:hypothetical protein